MTTQEPRIIINKSKTKRQDDIHLWLTKDTNRQFIFAELHDAIVDKIKTKYQKDDYEDTGFDTRRGQHQQSKFIFDKLAKISINTPRRGVPVGTGSIDFKIVYIVKFFLKQHIFYPSRKTERYTDGTVKEHPLEEERACFPREKEVYIRVAGLIKPDLESIDRAIKQINKYAYSKGSTQQNWIELEAIITYDENDKYDTVLDEEDIHIIRIPEPK